MVILDDGGGGEDGDSYCYYCVRSVASVAWKQSVAEQLGLPEPPKKPHTPYIRFLKHYIKNNKDRFPQLTHAGWHVLS